MAGIACGESVPSGQYRLEFRPRGLLKMIFGLLGSSIPFHRPGATAQSCDPRGRSKSATRSGGLVHKVSRARERGG